MRRSEANKWLESIGARPGHTVTGNTDLLIVGSNRGERKYEDALRKGVPIIPWSMFVCLGFKEKWNGIRIDQDHRFLSKILVHMLTIVDSCYAHFITAGNRKWGRAFSLGGTAIDRFLRGAWGPRPQGDATKFEDDLGITDASVERMLRHAGYAWIRMIEIIEEIHNEES